MFQGDKVIKYVKLVGYIISYSFHCLFQMSLVPYLMNEMIRDFERPLYDQNFGLGLFPSDLIVPRSELLALPLHSGYLRPWRLQDLMDSGLSEISQTKDGFNISLDVQQFKPDELSVKVVDDCVVVEGKHEERSDEHGHVSRQFTRRYMLPQDVDKQALTTNLSSDGVLQLHAPKLASLPQAGGTNIPIKQTNRPAIKPKKDDTVEKKQS